MSRQNSQPRSHPVLARSPTDHGFAGLRMDFWMEWHPTLRLLLAGCLAGGIGLSVPHFVTSPGWAAGQAEFILLFLGVGLVSAVLSPIIPLGLWMLTLGMPGWRPEGWLVSPGQLSGAAFLLSCGAAVAGNRFSPIHKHPAAWLVALLAAWLALSAATSFNDYGRPLTTYPLLYACVALGLAGTLRTAHDWRLLAWTIVLVTAIHAATGLIQALERGTLEAALRGEFGFRLRVQGTAANPITFGWNLTYALPAIIVLSLAEKRTLFRIVAVALGAGILATSGLTFNRQGVILSTVAIMATVLASPIRHRIWLAVAAGIGAIGLSVLLLPTMIRRLSTALEGSAGAASGGLFRDPSFLERRDAFITGYEAFQAHPTFGIGLGAFARAWRDFYPRDGSTFYYQSTLEVRQRYIDSGYFQVLVETGWAGFLVTALVLGVLALFVMAIWLHNSKSQGQSASETLSPSWASAMIIGMGAFVAVSTLVQDTLLNGRVWILIGLALALCVHQRSVENTSTGLNAASPP